MSFDPVSYAIGCGAGAARGYSDGYAAGETDGYAEGYSDGESSVLDGANGKVVSDGELVEQTPYGTVTENGSYDTTENDSVTVEVEQGYMGFETVSGTLDDPWGSLSFNEVLAAVGACFGTIHAAPMMAFDGSAIGMGSGAVALFPQSPAAVMGMAALVDASSSTAAKIIWDGNGLASAYVEQNGTITDLSQYAGLIDTVFYLPTQGGGDGQE